MVLIIISVENWLLFLRKLRYIFSGYFYEEKVQYDSICLNIF